MPTTIFYVLLVMFTVAPFNFFWFVAAIILDLIILARNHPVDPEDDY